ncbi:hypothetical protein J6590_097657 [Homalodisca vitripennis]|nr:hypothetical protein J6590_097657 [Homalodisca vitripennis]
MGVVLEVFNWSRSPLWCRVAFGKAFLGLQPAWVPLALGRRTLVAVLGNPDFTRALFSCPGWHGVAGSKCDQQALGGLQRPVGGLHEAVEDRWGSRSLNPGLWKTFRGKSNVPLKRPFGAPKPGLTLETAQAFKRAASAPRRANSPSGHAGALPSMLVMKIWSCRFFALAEEMLPGPRPEAE